MRIQWVLLFVFFSMCIFPPRECRSDANFGFEGTIDPTINPNYKYHYVTLPKDGLVTLTVAYEPKDKLGNDRVLTGVLNVPDYLATCTQGFTAGLYSGRVENGKTYGPFPAQAGRYELLLIPPWSPYDETYQYWGYIQYTTSVPSIADKDPTEGYNAFCVSGKFDDWGTLSPGSKRYGHIGYRRCQFDDCDNYNFKVAETGRYKFLFRSMQADFTASIEDNGWQNCYPYAYITTADSGMEGTSLGLYPQKTTAESPRYVGEGYDVVLTEGVQYAVRFGLYGPPSVSSREETGSTSAVTDYRNFYNKCYGALEFELVYGQYQFPLVLSSVTYSKVDICGSSEEIAATVFNPVDYATPGNVSYGIICTTPSLWSSKGGPINVIVPGKGKQTVKFRFDIPKELRGKDCELHVWTNGLDNAYGYIGEIDDFLHSGTINIHCGLNSSFLLDLLLHPDQ